MFSKLSLLALIAPLVSAITVQIPQNPTSGGVITINWTSDNGDPATFSFELINVAFNNAFAIANNVDTSLGSLNLTLPVVPVGAGYTIEAVNVGDINDVFSTTGTFSIGQTTSSSTGSSTTTTGSTSGNSSVTRTTSSSSTLALTTSTTTSPSITTTPTTSTTSSSTATPTAFNNSGASGLKAPGAAAALMLSVMAGAVALAL